MTTKRICLLLLCLCLLLVSCQKAPKEPPLTVHFLDVGQGDATLIRTAEGDVLIDAGPESAQPLLCLRLEELGVKALRLLILTHPDEDHIGGADGVLSRFPTEEVWTNGVVETHESAVALEAALDACGLTAKAVHYGSRFSLGGVTFMVLSPFSEPSDGNEGSLIFKVTFGEISMLFSGDAELKAEEELLEKYDPSQLSCELYKVGHHGSSTSSSKALLNAMTPRYAVVSCGRENPYGHPHGEVLAALEEVGAEVLRVDHVGEITFWSDGTKLERK